jgi:hypothetical protein
MPPSRPARRLPRSCRNPRHRRHRRRSSDSSSPPADARRNSRPAPGTGRSRRWSAECQAPRRRPIRQGESRNCHFHRGQGSRPEGPAPRSPPQPSRRARRPSGQDRTVPPTLAATSALGWPTSPGMNSVWRWRLERSTRSSSTSVSPPPRPPRDIAAPGCRSRRSRSTRHVLAASATCPAPPTSGRTMWRAKRSRRSGGSDMPCPYLQSRDEARGG